MFFKKIHLVYHLKEKGKKKLKFLLRILLLENLLKILIDNFSKDSIYFLSETSFELRRPPCTFEWPNPQQIGLSTEISRVLWPMYDWCPCTVYVP